MTKYEIAEVRERISAYVLKVALRDSLNQRFQAKGDALYIELEGNVSTSLQLSTMFRKSRTTVAARFSFRFNRKEWATLCGLDWSSRYAVVVDKMERDYLVSCARQGRPKGNLHVLVHSEDLVESLMNVGTWQWAVELAAVIDDRWRFGGSYTPNSDLNLSFIPLSSSSSEPQFLPAAYSLWNHANKNSDLEKLSANSCCR